MADPLLNKRVRVKKGPYRGYVGVVQHANETHVRMEFDANQKVRLPACVRA